MNTYTYERSHSSTKKDTQNKDKNLECMKLIDKAYEAEAKKNTVNLRDTLSKIKVKLQKLPYNQQLQWADTMVLKIKSLQKTRKEKQLTISLKSLLSMTNQLQIEYDYGAIEKVIKEHYYDRYGRGTVELYEKAGYAIGQFKTLEYEDPWYSKLYDSIVSIF